MNLKFRIKPGIVKTVFYLGRKASLLTLTQVSQTLISIFAIIYIIYISPKA
jgi:hypothetical protein